MTTLYPGRKWREAAQRTVARGAKNHVRGMRARCTRSLLVKLLGLEDGQEISEEHHVSGSCRRPLGALWMMLTRKWDALSVALVGCACLR